MCSNRCAKPVRPAVSLAGPTWYQRLTATIGRRLSLRRMTSRPFGSVYFSKSSFTTGGFTPAAAWGAEEAIAIATTRGRREGEGGATEKWGTHANATASPLSVSWVHGGSRRGECC